MDIDIAIEQLQDNWERQGIVTAPNDINEVLHFEFSRCQYLPSDFKQMYLATNGMMNLHPNDMDENGFLIYPLQEIPTIDEVFDKETMFDTGEYIIFAEYLHASWWFAVKTSKASDDYEIGIVGHAHWFKPITSSLGEFIAWCLEDAGELYDVGDVS